MGPGNAVEIFVFQDGNFLGSRCYSQDTITLGSSREATLRLRHPDVGAQHAIIRVEGKSVMIADNSSATGVLVNGKRVGSRTVRSYDEVVVGPFRLKISRLGSDADEDPGFGVTASNESTGNVPGQEAALPGEATTVEPTPYADAPVQAVADEDAATMVRRIRPEDREPAPNMGRLDRPAATGGRRDHAYEPIGDDTEGMLGSDHRTAGKDATHDSFETQNFDEQLTDQVKRSFGRKEPQPETGRASSDAPAPEKTRHSAPDNLPFQDAVDGAAVAADGALAATGEAPEAPLPHEPDPAGGSDFVYDDALDDDDEEPFEEPFSLLENVIRERFKTPADVDPFAAAEVIRYGDGEILDVLQAESNGTVKLFPDDFKLLDTLGSGRARLYFHTRFKGTIVRNGKARQLKKLVRPETLVDAKRGIHAIDLREGDYAQVLREDAGYLVRFVNPPKLPKASAGSGFAFSWTMVQIFLGSAAFHILVLALLGLGGTNADLVVETESEKFAKVTIKELKLEKPEKKEEPKPEPKPEPVKKKPTKVKKVKRVKRTTKRAPATKRARVQKKQVSNVLTALSNLKPVGGGPARSSLKALTNIAAVRTPSGSGVGGYKVSGVISKLAGKGVRLATGGFGGGKGTKVGRALLAGGRHGGIKALAGTGRRVRGRVRKAPTRSIRATGGVLSRAAIQQVVSKHMHKIQACYERQLLVTPGLAGKVVFDWVISTSGRVGSARQVSSSLRGAAVSRCILRQIRTWRFPKPQGGSVQVRYPFVFRQQGF